MKVFIAVVPPGGGETDYSLEAELPAMPQAGDYISVSNQEAGGSEDFIVKRSWWILKRPNDNDGKPTLEQAGVVAEMAYGPFSSESHKKAVKGYENRGKKAETFEATAY